MGEQDLAKAAASCQGCGTPPPHHRAKGAAVAAGSGALPLPDLGRHHPLRARGADLHCRTAGPGVPPLSPDLERRHPLIPSPVLAHTAAFLPMLLFFSRVLLVFSRSCCRFSPAWAKLLF
ncbi:hypothetical protein GUJ93_ZPchr0014g46772 [Zizania palustris]|uniref:Uncharacterized protein n=1 Tax=Zizania palustris TaxID=103762 RepID=A0A8J5T936_ZIZPA|nr:hypothetical protein GUJ93_ZPchr0014g46772 [Zizania palustris]